MILVECYFTQQKYNKLTSELAVVIFKNLTKMEAMVAIGRNSRGYFQFLLPNETDVLRVSSMVKSKGIETISVTRFNESPETSTSYAYMDKKVAEKEDEVKELVLLIQEVREAEKLMGLD